MSPAGPVRRRFRQQAQSASPSRASSTHITTGRCATNLFPASVAWKPGRRSSLYLKNALRKTFADVYKLALAKETAKKAADQISSVVGEQSGSCSGRPVHGVRQKFRRDRPSGRGSAEARSSSQQTSRKPCYRCDRHGHSPTSRPNTTSARRVMSSKPVDGTANHHELRGGAI